MTAPATSSGRTQLDRSPWATAASRLGAARGSRRCPRSTWTDLVAIATPIGSGGTARLRSSSPGCAARCVALPQVATGRSVREASSSRSRPTPSRSHPPRRSSGRCRRAGPARRGRGPSEWFTSPSICSARACVTASVTSRPTMTMPWIEGSSRQLVARTSKHPPLVGAHHQPVGRRGVRTRLHQVAPQRRGGAVAVVGVHDVQRGAPDVVDRRVAEHLLAGWVRVGQHAALADDGDQVGRVRDELAEPIPERLAREGVPARRGLW